MKSFRAFAGIVLASQLVTICQGQWRNTFSGMGSAATVNIQDTAATPHAKAENDKGGKGKSSSNGQAGSGSANAGNPAQPDPLDCGKLPVHPFSVDASGNVADTGKSLVGPACVEVFYNPIQSAVFLQSNLTVVAGPDINKTLLGAGAQGGLLPTEAVAEENISEAFDRLVSNRKDLSELFSGRKGEYTTAVTAQEVAIAAIARLRSTTLLLNAGQQPDAVLNGYKALQSSLRNAIQTGPSFSPTDQLDNRRRVLLDQFQKMANELASFPLTFSDGPKTDPNTIPCRMVRKDPQIASPKIAWADWVAHCKDQYDALTKGLAADIQDVQNYASSSDNVKRLKARLAVVQYWDGLFINMGLRTDMRPSDNVDIRKSFHVSKPVRCGNLFNQTGNTTVNILAADLEPTLDGNPPTIRVLGAFTTVTCATPFAITAGVGFSTIEQKEFAIVKSNGGAGNPSINTFAALNDSKIHPVPIAMMHVRLREWGNHVYALHGSFGVAGNLQGQSAGGSSAEFLPSTSLSFWRTMFVSAGPYIGTKATLAGGFKEGDPVPADITSIQGQVKRSYTVGFGFAITFTKP